MTNMTTTTTDIIFVSRVLAEMEGWEGIGQEELAALRHQVGAKIAAVFFPFSWPYLDFRGGKA